MASSNEAPLSVEAAVARILAAPSLRVLPAETVAIADGAGRVLVQPIVAHGPLPPHRNSAMDGYAVRATDLVGAAAESPRTLFEIGAVHAGKMPTRAVGAGEAMRIMTGGVVPDGADAVVMIEHVAVDAIGGRVVVKRTLAAGENIREAGEDVATGQTVLAAGALLDGASLALAAAVGAAQVAVYRRPSVAILTSGDELREVDAPPRPGSIIESNRLGLAALCAAIGAVPRILPIVADDPEKIRAACIDALASDFVISSGGVSVGDHDFIRPVLDALGARFAFWRVDMKPGKPVVVAEVRERLFFGLPGNPVSALVAFHLFVRPALRTAMGLPSADLARVRVQLADPVAGGPRRTFVRAAVCAAADGSLQATAAAKQGSHMLTSMAGANALLDIGANAPAQRECFALLLGPIISGA